MAIIQYDVDASNPIGLRQVHISWRRQVLKKR
jgi:hypothetical protein